MDPSGDFEPLPSPLGQKLASVVPRKVTEEMRFWGNQMHFDTFFIETLREASQAVFCRMKLLGSLKCQKFTILLVWNKIKL